METFNPKLDFPYSLNQEIYAPVNGIIYKGLIKKIEILNELIEYSMYKEVKTSYKIYVSFDRFKRELPYYDELDLIDTDPIVLTERLHKRFHDAMNPQVESNYKEREWLNKLYEEELVRYNQNRENHAQTKVPPETQPQPSNH